MARFIYRQWCLGQSLGIKEGFPWEVWFGLAWFGVQIVKTALGADAETSVERNSFNNFTIDLFGHFITPHCLYVSKIRMPNQDKSAQKEGVLAPGFGCLAKSPEAGIL